VLINWQIDANGRFIGVSIEEIVERHGQKSRALIQYAQRLLNEPSPCDLIQWNLQFA